MGIDKIEAKDLVEEYLFENRYRLKYCPIFNNEGKENWFSWHFSVDLKQAFEAISENSFVAALVKRYDADNICIYIEGNISFYHNYAQVQLYLQEEIWKNLRNIDHSTRAKVLELINWINGQKGVHKCIDEDENEFIEFFPYLVFDKNSDIQFTENLSYNEFLTEVNLDFYTGILPIRYLSYDIAFALLLGGHSLEEVEKFISDAIANTL